MNIFDEFFRDIPLCSEQHVSGHPVIEAWKARLKPAIEAGFREGDKLVRFGPFGDIHFPYFRMGNIDSIDLFGIDELLMFSFYNENRTRYRRAVDFGANIGLHSIMLSRCGFEVRSFEPDPVHLAMLNENLKRNSANAEVHAAAISFESGDAEFVRLLQNTTGNHLKGSKDNPFGAMDVFKVKVEAALPHLKWADFAKIDIEGHEAALLTALPPSIWSTTDALVEIGTKINAQTIFDYFDKSGVNLFAQKNGWTRASRADDLPVSHREGSLFVSCKETMPWPKSRQVS